MVQAKKCARCKWDLNKGKTEEADCILYAFLHCTELKEKLIWCLLKRVEDTWPARAETAKAMKTVPATEHARQCHNMQFSSCLCHKISSSYIHSKQQLKDRSMFCPRGFKIGAQRSKMLHSKTFGVILLCADENSELILNLATAITLVKLAPIA